MRSTKINISRIVGGGICVSAEDGQKVYQEVRDAVSSGDRVVLSFSGITRMTTAFLNAAVGQLYGEFTEAQVRERLGEPVDFEPWHLNRLKLVVDRAKEYFKDGSRIEAAFGSGRADDVDKNE